MPPLRQRLSDDLPRRGLAERPQEMSVRAVRQRAEPDPKSPAHSTAEALWLSLLSLKTGTPSSCSAGPLALCGLPCFSAHPRKRPWAPLTVVRTPREQTLPGSRRVDAVRPMLAPLTRLRSRAC